MQAAHYHTLRHVEDRHWWYATLQSLVLKTLARRLPARSAILDAGCGTGGMLRLVSGHWRAEGIDSSPQAVDYTQARGLTGRVGDVCALSYANGSFDAVLSLDVLYHAQVAPEQALAEMARVLRPGGMLVLNVAAFDALRGSHDETVCGARRYKACQVRELLKRHNLRVDMVHYWNAWLFLPLFARRLLSRRRAPGGRADDLSLPPVWLNRLLTTAGRVEASLCRVLRLPLGTSVFAVATRLESHVAVPQATSNT